MILLRTYNTNRRYLCNFSCVFVGLSVAPAQTSHITNASLIRTSTRHDMHPRYPTTHRCRNDEEISTGTGLGPGVHQTVQGARHRPGPGRGHGRFDTSLRDTPRPAVLSGTRHVRPGPVRQRRRRRRWRQRETRRSFSAVRRWPAHMHRYVFQSGLADFFVQTTVNFTINLSDK